MYTTAAATAMTTPKQIAHNAHREHPLFLRDDLGVSSFRCDGCGCDGLGHRYRCVECDFDLHEQCATATAPVTLPFHAQHPVEFDDQKAAAGVLSFSFPGTKTNTRSCCDLCGAPVAGMHYFCRPCGFAVHPVCAQLPVTAVSPVHPAHLVTLAASAPRKCTHCGADCVLWRYRCVPCGVELHPRCLLGNCLQTPLRIPRGVDTTGQCLWPK